MSFTGVQITKMQGGLGRRSANNDAHFGLIAGGVATALLPLGSVAKFIQLSDAEDLGITTAYDKANGVLVHYHIREFFRLCPGGVLYLLLVAKGTLQSDMVEQADGYITKLIFADTAEGKIKYIATAMNPGAYTATYPATNKGVSTDVLSAIAKAQATVEWLKSERNYFLDGVMIEGRDLDPDNTIGSLEDLRSLNCPNISVCIGADSAVTSATAAVGAAIGMLAQRKVSECLGSVDVASKSEAQKGQEFYSLSDTANGYFLKAVLSSGKAVAELTKTEKQALTDKGYIYAGYYEGFPGIYFSDSPTCVAADNDYAYIENNRVWNKAVRYMVAALTPRLKSEIAVDKTTGYIETTTTCEWQNAVLRKLNNMLADDEVSGVDVYIDPEQNILGGEPIKVKLAITPKGIAREIVGLVGFANPLA
jgi:hypothetical protein